MTPDQFPLPRALSLSGCRERTHLLISGLLLLVFTGLSLDLRAASPAYNVLFLRLVEWATAGSEKRFHELYDHTTDPQENVNVANLPGNQQLLRRLLEQPHAGWQKALPTK